MDQGEVTEKDDRQTHYYLWLPFILGICMGLVKIPRIVWKNICERGIMESLVGDGTKMGEKIAVRFNKLRKRSVTVQYHVCFAACELANIAILLLCFHIMNSLLNGKFWSYGADVSNYDSTELTSEELKSNPSLEKPNPMCSLFPKEVACNLCIGSIGGGCNDRSSILCILSNNLFNQYYFLILWFWWIFLLAISILGLIYRAAQMFIPYVSKAVFQTYLTPYGLDYAVARLSLRPSDYFLLGRLAINVKGGTMEEVLNELKYTKGSQENENLTGNA